MHQAPTGAKVEKRIYPLWAGAPGFEPRTEILEIPMIAISPRPQFLFFRFLMYRVLPAPFTEFVQTQLLLRSVLSLGFAGKIINPFANLALKFDKWFLFCCHMFEPKVGIEPTASFLPRKRSTTELLRRNKLRRLKFA